MNTQTTKQSIVWGSLFILFGLLSLAELYFDLAPWLWVGVLALAGLGAFLIYLTDRSNWLLLIPTYVMWAIAGLVSLLLLNMIPDGLVPLFVLTAVALPFIAVYLYDRSNWWALIPAYVLLGIGFMVMLIEYGFLGGFLVPAYVMLTVAIPFVIIYFLNPEEKWPLIPAGIMSFIGLSFVIAATSAQYIVAGILIIVGGWLVVRQLRQPKEKPIEKF